eukprot:scaffold75889_cov66-Phaeocystis_antarctica.AAC.3
MHAEVDKLTDEDIQAVEADWEKESLLTESVRESLKETIHPLYQIGEADKEPGSYTITCRLNAVQLIHAELTKEDSVYELLGDGATAKVKRTIDGKGDANKEEVVWVTAPGTPYHAHMAQTYAWLKERNYQGKHAPLTFKETGKETEMEAFIRSTQMSYLYMCVKTHKIPDMKTRYVAGGTSSPVEEAGVWLHRLLLTLMPAVHDMAAVVTNNLETELLPNRFSRPPRSGFTVLNTPDAVRRVTDLNDSFRGVRELRRQVASGKQFPPPVMAWLNDEWSQNVGVAACTHFGVRDFASLFTTLMHFLIKEEVGRLLRAIYAQHVGCVAQIARTKLPSGARTSTRRCGFCQTRRPHRAARSRRTGALPSSRPSNSSTSSSTAAASRWATASTSRSRASPWAPTRRPTSQTGC